MEALSPHDSVAAVRPGPGSPAAGTAVVRAFHDVLQSGAGLDRLRELVAPDYQPHLAAFVSPTALPAGIDALLARLRQVGSVPGRIRRTVADGELVFAHVEYSSVRPVAGVDIYRVDERGQIAEHWNVRQALQGVADAQEWRYSDAPGVQRAANPGRAWLRERIMRMLRELWVQGAASLVPEYYSERYVQHNPDMPGGYQRIVEVVSNDIRRYIEATGGPFPVDVHRIAVEGDLACVHLSLNMAGINRSEGRRSTNVDIFRVDGDGRMTEHWDVLQIQGEELPDEATVF